VARHYNQMPRIRRGRIYAAYFTWSSPYRRRLQNENARVIVVFLWLFHFMAETSLRDPQGRRPNGAAAGLEAGLFLAFDPATADAFTPPSAAEAPQTTRVVR